jgi:hypothetical protein
VPGSTHLELAEVTDEELQLLQQSRRVGVERRHHLQQRRHAEQRDVLNDAALRAQCALTQHKGPLGLVAGLPQVFVQQQQDRAPHLHVLDELVQRRAAARELRRRHK